jgi:hypothetical protein
MSKRVLASAIKSAVNNAAIAQVAAAGFTVSNSYCSFSGKTAFAVWRNTRGNWSVNYAVGRTFRLNYPAIADDALLTRAEADLIAAYTLHETGHIAYTNNNVSLAAQSFGGHAKVSNLHALANGFEDGRMEWVVINAGIARNARNQFARLLNKLTFDVSPQYNPCNIANAPFTIAVLTRDALGNGNKYSAGLLDRIPEPFKAIYAQIYEWCKTAPDGFDENLWSYQMADRFMTAWKKMREANPVQKIEGEDGPVVDIEDRPPESYGDGLDEIDSPDDEFEDEPEQEGGAKKPDEDTSSGLDGDDEEEDDDFENAGSAPSASEDDDEEEDDDEDGQPTGGDGDEGDEPTDEGTASAESNGEGEDDGDESDGESEQSGGNDAGFSESTDQGPMESPELSLDDVFKRINKRNSGPTRTTMPPFYAGSRDIDVMDIYKQFDYVE